MLPRLRAWGLCLLGAVGCTSETDLEPTLANIQTHVFDEGCANGACHDLENHAGKLDLWDGASYGSLVGVEVTNGVAAENGWLRVVPGEPDRSFLIRKLEFPGIGEGSPMPSAGQTLDPYYVDLIRQWIEDGARP